MRSVHVSMVHVAMAVFVHEDISRDALEELDAFQRASSKRCYEYNREARATTE